MSDKLYRFTPDENGAASIETRRGKLIVSTGAADGERCIAVKIVSGQMFMLTKKGARGLRDLLNDALGRL